jgi:uncharacterized repeat protein (TIGR03803 family)
MQQESTMPSAKLGLRFGGMICSAAIASLGLSSSTNAAALSSTRAQTFTESVLYSFMGGADGLDPADALFPDAKGNLYGTTYQGGNISDCSGNGCGVVFKLNEAGRETALYEFTGGADGGGPFAGLVQDAKGHFYGTTYDGGSDGFGVVFRVTKRGKETVLYSFTGGADGGNPEGGLVRDADGNLFGTTALGGSGGAGTVFKITKDGKEVVLYSFTGGVDGGQPRAGLLQDARGDLYSTTEVGGSENAGVVFKVTKSGKESVLYSFTGGVDGGQPRSGLLEGPNGDLFGTTVLGGSNDVGVVFKVTKSGTESVLHSFTGGTDGMYAGAGLIQDANGNLYSTTTAGGAYGAGVVFEVTATGDESILYSFTGNNDGGYPVAGLLQDAGGNLYGTTSGGGADGDGVVFKLAP